MKRMFLWLLAGIFISSVVQAQDAPTESSVKKLTFSIEQAKTFALTHNKSMLKTGLALKQAEESRWEAIANYLPQVNASMSYNNFLGAELELFGQKIPMESSSTLTLQAVQPIFNMNILVGMQLAEIGKKMSQNAIQQTELAIKQNVSMSYYSILVSEHSKSILEKNLANVKVLAKAIRTKVNVGIGEPIEADQMDLTVANLENTVQVIDMNIEMAYNSMRLLLGLGVNDELKLTSSISELTDKTSTYDLLLKQFDLDNNIDKKTSDLMVEMSEEQLKSSKYSYLPTFNAIFQHNEKLLTSGFDMTMKNTLVLQASVPLFSSGKNSSNVKKAKLALQSSKLDNELAKDQLLLQEKQLKFNLKSAQSGFEIQKKNIEVSQRVFDNITKKFEQGLSSSLEVTTANNNLLTAQSNYISSVMTLLGAQDALQKLLGML